MSAPTIPAAPSAAPASTPAAAAGTEVAAGDFLLMLGQLLGAPVAASASKSNVVSTAADDGDLEAATKDAAEVTGVPVPAGIVPLPQAAPAKGNAPIEVIAGLQAGGEGSAKASAALSRALPEALMSVDSGAVETPAPAPPAATADLSHQLRVSASADPGPQRPLHQPVGTSAWADELGTRMVLMSERGQQSASLRLNPENLGPLEVRISVRDDQASVWFGSAHSDTRAAIEQALPRLRELFESQGLSLTDAGVHHEAPREQSRQSASAMNNSNGSGEAEGTSVEIAARLGLVDEYV